MTGPVTHVQLIVSGYLVESVGFLDGSPPILSNRPVFAQSFEICQVSPFLLFRPLESPRISLRAHSPVHVDMGRDKNTEARVWCDYRCPRDFKGGKNAADILRCIEELPDRLRLVYITQGPRIMEQVGMRFETG